MKSLDIPLVQYRDLIASSQYWDFLIPGEMPVEEKLVHMRAYMDMGGSLSDAIGCYLRVCDASQARAIQWTIVEYLSAMMPGEVIDPRTDIMERIKNLGREGLVELLSMEIRKRVRRNRGGGWSMVPGRSMNVRSLCLVERIPEMASPANTSLWNDPGKGLWVN